jgi:tetratricopeptide (TPR) repeat protein
MKQAFALLTGLLIWALASAQYPVQSVPPKQMVLDYDLMRTKSSFPNISETRAMITEAIGWTLQNNGLWLSQQNQIPWKDASLNRTTRQSRKLTEQDREGSTEVEQEQEMPKQKNKTRSSEASSWTDPVPDKGSRPSFKLGKENFINLEVRDVLVNNEMYVVIIWRFRTGWYEFPILMEDWHKQTGLTYYVCKQSKWRNVIPENMEFNKVYITNLEVLCNGTLMDPDEAFLNSTVAYNIDNTLSKQLVAPHNLLIGFVGVQLGGKTTARFRLITVMNKDRFYRPYLDPKNRSKIIKGSYYETDFNTFKSFIHYNGGGFMPAIASTGTPGTADDFYRRGISDYSSGNYFQAINDFSEAAKYQPYANFFLTYAYRANAYQKMGNLSLAMMDFDRALSLKPADPNYYNAWLTVIYNRGVARFNNKDKDGACADWTTAQQFGFKDAANEQAIKDNCRNYRYNGPSVAMTPGVYSNLQDQSGPEYMTDYYKVYWEGVWKYEHGNFQEAVRYFNRAIELKPQEKAFMVYYYRGSSKLKLSDFTGALADLDIALAFHANGQGDGSLLKMVYYNHGMANYMIGNYSMACSDFQKATSAGLNNPENQDFIRQVCR